MNDSEWRINALEARVEQLEDFVDGFRGSLGEAIAILRGENDE